MYRAAEPEWPVYENKSFEGGLPFKGPVLKVHQQRMHSEDKTLYSRKLMAAPFTFGNLDEIKQRTVQFDREAPYIRSTQVRDYADTGATLATTTVAQLTNKDVETLWGKNKPAYLEKKVFFQRAPEDQFKVKPRMPTYPDRSNPNARFEEQVEVGVVKPSEPPAAKEAAAPSQKPTLTLPPPSERLGTPQQPLPLPPKWEFPPTAAEKAAAAAAAAAAALAANKAEAVAPVKKVIVVNKPDTSVAFKHLTVPPEYHHLHFTASRLDSFCSLTKKEFDVNKAQCGESHVNLKEEYIPYKYGKGRPGLGGPRRNPNNFD